MKSAYVLFQDICICAGDVIQFSVVTPSFPDWRVSATREGFHYRGLQLNVNSSFLKLSQEHIRLKLV